MEKWLRWRGLQDAGEELVKVVEIACVLSRV